MLFSALLGVVSFADEGAETPALEITEASLKFESTVYLLVAVDASKVYTGETALADAKAAVTVKITNTVTNEVFTLTPDEELTEGVNKIVFTLTKLGAKNMGDELSIQAYNGANASGKAKSYSILEWALKAKGISDSLDLVLETMLDYGHSAQVAFDNHIAKASYDLSKSYGLVVVNGSKEGKAIKLAGTPVSFTPAESVGANAELHDMSYRTQNSITVTEGYSKYFYIGDAQRTIYNFDFTKANLTESKTPDPTKTSAVNFNVYSTLASNGTTTTPSGSNGVNYANLTSAMYTPACGSGYYPGTVTTSVVGGDNGYMKVAVSGKQSVAVQSAAGCDKVVNTLEDGVFTMVWTIGKDGTTNMPTQTNRFRGSSSSNVAAFFVISNSGTNSYIKGMNKNDNTNPPTIAIINGEEGKQKFVTIYLVVDMNANTFTYYVDGSSEVLTTSAPTASGKTLKDVMSSGSFIDWTMSGVSNVTLLIQRAIVLKGNIFN